MGYEIFLFSIKIYLTFIISSTCYNCILIDYRYVRPGEWSAPLQDSILQGADQHIRAGIHEGELRQSTQALWTGQAAESAGKYNQGMKGFEKMIKNNNS